MIKYNYNIIVPYTDDLKSDHFMEYMYYTNKMCTYMYGYL